MAVIQSRVKDFNVLVEHHIGKGKSRAKAIGIVARQRPDLHAEYLVSVNPPHAEARIRRERGAA